MNKALTALLIAVALPVLGQPLQGGNHRPSARGPGPVQLRPHPEDSAFGCRPHPNRWAGDFAGLTPERWRAGHWVHALHDHKLAWWWIVGSDRFFYVDPVFPYPDMYAPPGSAFGWLYWCEAQQDYYPYVTWCPSGWRQLPVH